MKLTFAFILFALAIGVCANPLTYGAKGGGGKSADTKGGGGSGATKGGGGNSNTSAPPSKGNSSASTKGGGGQKKGLRPLAEKSKKPAQPVKDVKRPKPERDVETTPKSTTQKSIIAQKSTTQKSVDKQNQNRTESTPKTGDAEPKPLAHTTLYRQELNGKDMHSVESILEKKGEILVTEKSKPITPQQSQQVQPAKPESLPVASEPSSIAANGNVVLSLAASEKPETEDLRWD